MRNYFYHMEITETGIPCMVAEKGTYKVDMRMRYDSPEKIVELVSEIGLCNRAEEYVYAAYFDTHCKLIGLCEISHGTVNMSPLSPREVMQRALLLGATSFILIHNHPSGVVEPSIYDDEVTKRINEAGNLLGICLNDHVIIGKEFGSIFHYSYREQGKI